MSTCRNRDLVNSLPGSTMTSMSVGQHANQPPVGHRKRGDVVSSNWGDDRDALIDHDAIITVNDGTSSDGTGSPTLVNSHTAYRDHTMGQLWSFHAHRSTTVYDGVVLADGAS